MADTIVIGGTEFPIKTTIDGRSCTRKANLSDILLWDVFGRLYKGPFTTTLETGEPIPSCCHVDPVETKEGIKKSFLLYDDVDDERACCIKDSNGRVVAVARSIIAACQLVDALNKQPTNIKEGGLLGISPSGGLSRKTPEDRFAFWCIQIEPNNGETDNTGEPLKTSYIQPIMYRYTEYPSLTRNPMSALRFKGSFSAKLAIKAILEEILPTTDARSTMRERWNWEGMKPVMVKFAYNVIS